MKLAMIFPGQGSQSVGMLRAYDGLPGILEVREKATAVLGAQFLRLLDDGPAEQLNLTVNTQPAMVTAGYAAYCAWRALGGPAPDTVAGHSLGEYTALTAAGAITFDDCLPLVRFRAQAMQEAVPAGQGAMAAILGLDDADIEAACREAAQGETVQPANFNSPGQVVIAGTAAAVDRAIEATKAKGAKRAIKLPVSVPSHSPLMQPAAERLAAKLQQVSFGPREVRDIYTVDVRKHGDEGSIRKALVEQLVKPVRWTETIQAMLADGVRVIVECGPKGVLTGLNRRIERNKDIAMLAIEDAESLQQALQTCRSNA
jgi:[acyl-carrier-protein] S-malonyltransferase